MLKRLKMVINNFSEKMAKENEKVYGKGTPDCCQLNRQNDDSKK